MFERLIGLIGEEKFNKLKNSHIMVIGCGGVGGYVVEMLARCGIGTITIVDFDTVDISNINRQIIALNSNISKYKVDLLENRVMDINPNCKVTKIKEKLTENNINNILDKNVDYIIDAIDDIKMKKEIIKICTTKNIKFITCLGTGRRIDPKKIEITTLDKTNYDPIAKILRKYVKDNKINKKITVLFSSEIPAKANGANVIYSSCFVPSTAGILLANYVFRNIIN